MDGAPFKIMIKTPAIPAPDKIDPPIHRETDFAAIAEKAGVTLLTKIPDPPPSIISVSPIQADRVPKVFVGLCTRDWQTEAHTAESVRNIGRVCRVEVVPRYMMNDGVARARNNLAAAFLESDCDILFFLDNDIIIEPLHFTRLISVVEARGIVCALYPKKQPAIEWVVNWLPGEIADAAGYCKVKHAGTGSMAISRAMLTSFIAKNPQIEYRGDPAPDAVRWDLFPMHAENGRYLSEDWKFCEMARAAGWDIWIDTQSQLRHIGKIVYPLQFTLSDEDVVDIVAHRYHIDSDHVRTFIASGTKSPGLMGGHREAGVRHWPREYPVGDLHQGDVLAGCYDMPYFIETGKEFAVLDIGADVGAFARWASKRWPKCQLHCYESRPELVGPLQCTADAIGDKHGVKPIVYAGTLAPKDVAGLPPAAVIKIDAQGSERDLVAALAAEGRLEEVDCIMIKYYDELTAYFIGSILFPLGFMRHNQQRFATENTGIVKFIRRPAP